MVCSGLRIPHMDIKFKQCVLLPPYALNSLFNHTAYYDEQTVHEVHNIYQRDGTYMIYYWCSLSLYTY